MMTITGGGTMTNRTVIAAALAATLLLAAAGCGREPQSAGEAAGNAGAPAALTGLRVVPVAAGKVALTRELAGSVQSAAVSQVSARIMAQVLSVAVREGDRVAKGQVLVTLDDRDLQAKVRQAEGAVRQAEAAVRQAEGARAQASAQLELAEATHARFTALLEGKAVSRQEYENVAAQEAVARAALSQADGAVAQAASAVAQAASGLDEARTWLGFAQVAAPVAGRVTAKRIDAGSTAAPGQPLLVIEPLGRYRLELPVDASLSGTVSTGTPLAGAVDAAGYRDTVAVSEVVPAADPVSRTFLVRADLPAEPR
jgi:multidrug efflux pump subunit AcrA (membrane-fusion protein)